MKFKNSFNELTSPLRCPSEEKSGNKLEIRKATKEDLEQLRDIAYSHDLYELAFTDTWDKNFSKTNRWKRMVLKEINSTKNFVLVLLLDKKIVGSARVNVHLIKSRVKSKVLEIKTLFIYEKYRGNSVGSKALKYIEDYAKENHFERLRVESLINNEGALKFYKNNGFEEFSIGLEKDI